MSNNFTRRGFVATASTLGAAVGSLLHPQGRSSATQAAASAAASPAFAPNDAAAIQYFPDGVPRCTLGKTGIETSILGMGTGMTGGRPYYDMGEAAFIELMHTAFDQGVRYIDTAQNYRTHVYVQHALRGWKREDFFLLTKTPSPSEERVKADIDRYLYELETHYLDSVLLHCMTNDRWPQERAGAWKALQDEKQRGRVRAIGVSCHSLDAFKKCLEVDELDVVLVRINPFGKDFLTDDDPDKVVPVIKALHDKGVGILGMKIFGEGRCTEAAQRRESLEFVTGLGTVDTMTIGFTKIPEVHETLGMLADIYAKK
ncbi:MAG: aldo/keto reductase [Planctomycetaceae bacterium]|nr:aldo/keto reductase [Planctomycetaceae bacterium]